MTKNQIDYVRYREDQRHNLAEEGERARSNCANEQITSAHYSRMDTETERSNRERERQGMLTINENVRSNLARESETRRSNLANEAETRRSHLANEAIGRSNAYSNSRMADAALSQASTASRRADIEQMNAYTRNFEAQTGRMNAESNALNAQTNRNRLTSDIINAAISNSQRAQQLDQQERRLLTDQIYGGINTYTNVTKMITDSFSNLKPNLNAGAITKLVGVL